MKKLVLAMTAFAALTGCGAAPEPLAHNRAETLKKIWEAEQTAIRAFGKRDAGESASMYAPDATLMLTNMRAVHGADIRPVLSEMMADPNFSMTFNTARVEAPESGEFGYTRGTYVMTTTDPKSKKLLRESGKYLTVYAKQADGSWKMVDDINNPDGPASPVADN